MKTFCQKSTSKRRKIAWEKNKKSTKHCLHFNFVEIIPLYSYA